MNAKFASHYELIEIYGYRVLADDLGLERKAVSMWKSRSHIPVDVWGDLVNVARKRGISVTIQQLYETRLQAS